MQSILLVDDDEDDREIFSMALQEVSVKTTYATARNGVEALAYLRAGECAKPDLIFLDLNMPRMSGRDCYQELKKIANLQSTPVYIYSTSVDNIRDMPQPEEGRMLYYMAKPSDLRTLVSVLQAILEENEELNRNNDINITT